MTLTVSQSDWLRVRAYLTEHRHALAVDAAGDYPAERRLAGMLLLAAPEWQLAEPVPLHDIELAFVPRPPPAEACRARRGHGAAAAGTAGRDPLPVLLGRAAGSGGPGGVREPAYLPADRG